MFRTSAPVTGQVFHDREAEAKRVSRVLDSLEQGAPRWLAIVGVRKVGKTSLILEVARRAEAAGKSIAFITLDVFEALPVSTAFFKQYALRVADRLLASSLGLSLESLATHPASYTQELASSPGFTRLPGPLRAALLRLPDWKVDEAFIRWAVDLPETLCQATQQKAVVAIDEFQELASLGNAKMDPLPLMRSLWQRHRAVTYIISGSARTMLTELVTSKRSPFFQHFDLMPLGSFAPADALSLLDEFAPRGRKIPKIVAALAVKLTAGHPFYLQVLGESLIEREPPYDEDDLKEVLQTVLFSKSGRLGLYFQNEFERIVGKSSQMAAALSALANGPMRLGQLAKAIGSPSGATVRTIERMGDAVEKREDGEYQLSDPTFALWLKWRAPGGAVVPMKVVGDEAEIAAAQHLSDLGFDLVYQSKASRGAFDLLATRGAAQLGIQVKRTKLPVTFAAAAWKRMEGEAQRFGWKWVVAAVDEAHAVHFLDPEYARKRKQHTLPKGAVIPNLLLWLDEDGRK